MTIRRLRSASSSCAHPLSDACLRRRFVYICLNRCTYGSLTPSVSLRCLSLTRRCPPMSRVTPAIALTLTSVDAVDLPEHLRVELVDQFLDRAPDQRLLLRRDDQRVLVVGLEVADLLDGDEPQVVALRRRDPAQVLLRALRRLRPATFSRPSRLAGAPRDLLLEPRDRRREARRGERLHHVVDRALLESRDRVLVVGGDEGDVALAARLLRDFEPGQAGHLDVEEQDVRRVHGERPQRLDAVLGLGADDELRPELRERSP